MTQKYQAIMMQNETWTVVYLPSNENLSHHETKSEALAAIKRYKAADERRARQSSDSSIECPHCHWGFSPSVINQHIREKH